MARQKRITIDNEHYYIDLVFYHRILRCLILVDLKVGKLEHKDVGQMNFYLNYIKDKEMLEGENPPVGIILWTETGRSRVFVADLPIPQQVFYWKMRKLTLFQSQFCCHYIFYC